VPLPHRTFCAFLVGLWLTIACLKADYKAPTDYTLREWNESQGLASNEVASVLQDENGYLWVITNLGPARFDGTSFETIKMPSEVSPRGMIYYRGPSANGYAGLLAPANIVAGTDGVSTAQTDGYYIQNLRGEFQFNHEPRLTGKVVRVVFADPSGALWLGCDDGTLLRRNKQETIVFPSQTGSSGKKSVPSFATDAQEQLWVSIGYVAARFDGTRWISIWSDSNESEIRIVSSHTGGPWLITRSSLLKWTGDKLEEITPLPDLLGAHFIQSAMEDRHGNLWLGTRSQGLFRLAEKNLLHVPTSGEDIVSICEDTEDDIWIATNGGGLNRLRPKAHQLFDQASGLKDNFSYTVAEDANGTIWLANRDGGAARINDEGKVDPISRRANWRPFSAMSVYPAASGGVWITSGIGIFRTNAETAETIQRAPLLPNYKVVRSSFVALNGDYWFASDPDRVVRWHNGQLTTFGSNEGFDGREVRAFAEDSTGNIWLGASDGRLYRSNGDRFERVSFNGSGNVGAIQVLRFETDGTLLAGTTRHGILFFPAGNRSAPRMLDSNSGLPNNNITQILADDYGRYWFASRGGIFWMHSSQIRAFIDNKPEHIHAVMLGVDDGIPELSCLGLFQPSAWKARNGMLWFATRRGVLCTNPALTTDEDHLPPVTVLGIKCDGIAQPVFNEQEIRSTVRKTEIRLSVLCLSAPERVLVRYRLDGFDNDWVVQKNSRVATYPRLPAGNYVFRAMASNGNGIWNEQAELLTISVVPPWWQSLWAQLIYLLMLVSAVAVIVRIWSHRRLRRRLQKLQEERALERERTRIAQNIHDELGASLTHISLLTQAAQHENPTQAASFEKIYAATHDITRAMDEVVWAVNPKCDDLENFVYYVSNFAQNLLGAANIRCRLDLPSDPPSIHLTSPVRHNLFLCCKETLNNVIKHAKADQVFIAINITDNTMKLAIADNGRGLDTSAPPSNDKLRISRGQGLGNMHSRMAEIGGTCDLSPQAGGGTIVTFSIKLFTNTP